MLAVGSARTVAKLLKAFDRTWISFFFFLSLFFIIIHFAACLTKEEKKIMYSSSPLYTITLLLLCLLYARWRLISASYVLTRECAN